MLTMALVAMALIIVSSLAKSGASCRCHGMVLAGVDSILIRFIASTSRGSVFVLSLFIVINGSCS